MHITRKRYLLAPALLLVFATLPAAAQVDFSGEWAPFYHEDAVERGPGAELGDYTELPINEAARMQADSYDADRISVVEEYQCRPHSPDYGFRSLGNLRIWRDIDPRSQRTVAFHSHTLAYDNERTIFIDDRPHPPEYAAHTWQGFSTAKWEGNMLTITTTHLKENYLRRNALPRSDRAIITEHWIRHGDILTVIAITEDPVFLEEPLVRSTNWYLDPGQHLEPYGCEYEPEVPRPEGTVPNFLPGKNPFLHEFADFYGLPFESTRGGKETLYPEYQEKMKDYKPPAKCERYCRCLGLFECNVNPPR
jgi:hypothetical protein